jgi:hypothetical protein
MYLTCNVSLPKLKAFNNLLINSLLPELTASSKISIDTSLLILFSSVLFFLPSSLEGKLKKNAPEQRSQAISYFRLWREWNWRLKVKSFWCNFQTA